MHKTFAALFVLSVGGCASTPEVLCDHEEELSVLASAPPEASALLAEIRSLSATAVDDQRDHVFWLRSNSGDLYLCTYNRRPVLTGTCGAVVHRFTKRANGYIVDSTSVSACH